MAVSCVVSAFLLRGRQIHDESGFSADVLAEIGNVFCCRGKFALVNQTVDQSKDLEHEQIFVRVAVRRHGIVEVPL